MVVCGRSPMLARRWFTAVRATLVIVLTSCCVMGGEKSSFKIEGLRSACGSNAGVSVGNRRGEATRCSVRLRLFAGGTVDQCHRSGPGRGKNVGELALDIGSRGWSHVEYPILSRYPK